MRATITAAGACACLNGCGATLAATGGNTWSNSSIYGCACPLHVITVNCNAAGRWHAQVTCGTYMAEADSVLASCSPVQIVFNLTMGSAPFFPCCSGPITLTVTL